MSTTPNYTDLLSAYAAYPSPIRPYLIYADTLEEIRIQLTKSTRLAFLDLVARINIAKPQQPILVRVDHTAEKLGISTKSVSRAIKLMIENEWLEASKQHDGRNNNGEFAWREFIVRPHFALFCALRCRAETQTTMNALPRPLPPLPTRAFSLLREHLRSRILVRSPRHRTLANEIPLNLQTSLANLTAIWRRRFRS